LKCPKCGNEYFKTPEIVALEGELVKLTSTKLNKTASPEDKQSFFSAALTYEAEKGYKTGFAAHQYRDKYGVWPNAMKKVKGEITQEYRNHVTAKAIRRSKGNPSHKGKEKNNPLKNIMDGYEYKKQMSSDNRVMIRCSRDNKFIGWAEQTREIMAQTEL